MTQTNLFYEFIKAIKNDSIDVVKRIYFLENNNIIGNTDLTRAFRCACRHGKKDIAKWIYSVGNFENKKLEKNIEYNGYLERNENTEYRDYCITKACEKGHLDIVIWLSSLGIIMSSPKKTLVEVCSNGYIDVATWIFNNYEIDTGFCENEFVFEEGYDSQYWSSEVIYEYGTCYAALYKAIANGHMNIVNRLVRVCKISNFSSNFFKFAFVGICGEKQCDMAKWLYSQHNFSSDVLEKAFQEACSNNDCDTAKWIYTLGDVNVHANKDSAFIDSCSARFDLNIYKENYTQDIAIWLYSITTFDDAVHQQAFISACESGLLCVAKWLYEKNKKVIEVYSDALNGADLGCSHGDVVDWLKTLGVVCDSDNKCVAKSDDIDDDHDDATESDEDDIRTQNLAYGV